MTQASKERTGKPVHIAFGADARFAPAMGVAISSILLNNSHINIVFHVIATQLPPADLQRLQALTEHHGVELCLHMIDNLAFGIAAPLFSCAAYYRLLISSLFRGVAQRVLYLDADIICLGDISELNDLDIGDAIVAAAVDPGITSSPHKLTIGLPPDATYFNSGVLLLDLGRWDEHDITRKTIDLLMQNKGKFRSFEQDALNFLLLGKVAPLPSKWNTLWTELNPKGHIPSETIFLHYVAFKPWYEWSPNFNEPTFKKYRKLSPWARHRMYDPVEDYPRGRKDKVRYLRHLIKTGHFLNAARWYFSYRATGKNDHTIASQ
jgi:lipopolysaccharide biosynthesis glycosyltransferase